MKKKSIVFFAILVVLNTSCDLFEYSSYDAPELDEREKNLTKKNLDLIGKINITSKDTFCFAIIADSHIEYSYLEKAINQINNDNKISFLMHLGDITDGGIIKEFHWANHIIARLNIPYLVLIGNHDYLSNGKKNYNQMFGESSFTFEFNNTKFVCFDDIIWENNNRYPDFNWLENNLSNTDQYNHVFVFSHIPPVSDQFDDFCREKFTKIVTENNVNCTFHGHVHNYSFNPYPGNPDIYYFTAEYLKSHTYYKVFISDTSFTIVPVMF